MSTPTHLTVGQAVRRFCLDCLCAETAHQAYDCLSAICPICPAHPGRGKPVPQAIQPDGSPPHELERAERLHRERPRQRPTRRMVRQQCELCLPERKDQRHCDEQGCALFVYCHRSPEGQPKRRLSVRQRRAVARNLRPSHRAPVRLTGR